MLGHGEFFGGASRILRFRFRALIRDFSDCKENEDPKSSKGTFSFYSLLNTPIAQNDHRVGLFCWLGSPLSVFHMVPF